MKKVKRGSSLVELLAVIVIMGIIAAIAVPTVGALLKNTRKKAAGAEIIALVDMIDKYRMSEDVHGATSYRINLDKKIETNTIRIVGVGENSTEQQIINEYFSGISEWTGTRNGFMGTITYDENKKVSVTGTLFKDKYSYVFENATLDNNYKPVDEKKS